MDIKNLVYEAQKMQNKIQKIQKTLEKIMVQGESGGGMVIITMSCKGEIQTLKIDKSLLHSNKDSEILEDLIVAAFNNARKKMKVKTNDYMLSTGLPDYPIF